MPGTANFLIGGRYPWVVVALSRTGGAGEGINVKAEFWHQRWEDNEIGFHQDEINVHLQSYWKELAIPAGSTVFVPLCGKSRDLLWLMGEGYRVIGVELSPIAAQAFFTENHLQPHVSDDEHFTHYELDELLLLCGDFFDIGAEELSSVKGVYDRASLVALPTNMREDYVAHMGKVLPAHTETLLVGMDYPQQEMGGPPFAVNSAEIERLYADDYQITVLGQLDILAENPRFRERGISRMEETIYRLTPGA